MRIPRVSFIGLILVVGLASIARDARASLEIEKTVIAPSPLCEGDQVLITLYINRRAYVQSYVCASRSTQWKYGWCPT